jgi:hypothetical protein
MPLRGLQGQPEVAWHSPQDPRGGHAIPSTGVRSPRRGCSSGTSANRFGVAQRCRERRASGARGGPRRAQGAAAGAADTALGQRATPVEGPVSSTTRRAARGAGSAHFKNRAAAGSGSALQLSRGDAAARVAARTRLHPQVTRENRRDTPHCVNKRPRLRSVALVRRRPSGILQPIDRCGGSRRRESARETSRPRRRGRRTNAPLREARDG